MPQISLQNITFAYEGARENVFENVTLQLDTSWKLGLIGRNGRGKTTLLRLLTGQLEYSGTIAAGVEFEYFPCPIPEPGLTAEQAARAVYAQLTRWELECELNLLAFDPKALAAPFARLSPGEQTKVLLAALFLKPNAFLLIDEPTNHLDANARLALAKYLNRKSGFILVSHDRAVLDACVDHIVSINRANIEVQQGNFSSWQANKDAQDRFEAGQNQRLQKDIKRLREAAKRAGDWSDQTEQSKKGAVDRGFVGHKAAKMMSRAKQIEHRQNQAVENKSKLLQNIDRADELKLHPLQYGKPVLARVRELSIVYDGAAVCAGLNFTVETGDRIALMGKNGCGKSSVLQLLRGAALDYTGECAVGGGLKISYVAQTSAGLRGGLRDYAEGLGIDESLFKAILRKLDFSREQFALDLREFSQGQKKKVLLAGSLCEPAHLYLWDEPLNYIDILSRGQIEDLILRYQPTLVFVEHDARFAETIATKRVVF